MRAQEEPILVSLVACTPGDPSLTAMLDLARAELGGGLVQLPAPAPGELAITQDCATGDLELSRTGSTLATQHVRLSDVPPELRARVAALALSEYALSTAGALKPKSAADAKPDGSAPPPRRRPLQLDPELLPKPDVALEPPRTWTLGPEVRLFALKPSLAFGGRTSFIRGRVEWSAFGLFQRHSHALGTVGVGVFGLGLSGMLAQHQGSTDVALSMGGELGVTWGKGDSRGSEPDNYALRPYGALMTWVSLGWRVGERSVTRAQLGAGYAVGIEAQVQGQGLATSGGPLITLVLAFGATR